MDAATDTIPQTETVARLLADATAVLAAAGVQTPRLDAEVLLAAACGVDRGALYARPREAILPHCRDDLRSMLARRIAREPLQYIVGRQEFWSLDFVATPDVLIPRPETELLVELAIEALCGFPRAPGEGQGEGKRRAAQPLTVCDLGTGSGCIAVALACELPGAEIWALDSSRPALAVAMTNARRHRVADRIHFVESDLFAAVDGQCFDAIIANPPYVSSVELERLQPELAWEPRHALDGGPAGLDVIRRLVNAAPEYLVDGGWLIMEIGADQPEPVRALAESVQFSEVSVRTDYAGLPRVLLARR
jgi:release factor glutamine methyltransferase